MGSPRAKLVLSTGTSVHAVPVHGMLVVGRAQSCQLVLESTKVSRMHAQFWIEHERMWVEDMGSRNGVLVNGTKIEGRTRLDVGDLVLIGDRTLEVANRSADRNPTMPVMEAATDAPAPAVPKPGRVFPAPIPRADDDTAPVHVEGAGPLRGFLDAASAALREGKLHDAADAMRHFCETIQETAHLGGGDRSALEGATKVLLALAEQARESEWIERLLAARQRMAVPLGVAESERCSELIGALPPGPDAARRAYVTWMKTQQLRLPQREAVKRLSEARGKKPR